MELETTRETKRAFINAGRYSAIVSIDADYETIDVTATHDNVRRVFRGQKRTKIEMDVLNEGVDIAALLQVIEAELQRQSKA